MTRNTPGNDHEQSFTKPLGEALRIVMRSRNEPLNAQTENTGVFAGEKSGKRPDMLIIDDCLPPIVIECSYQKNDANDDAIRKLCAVTKAGRRVVHTCIAVHVPSKFKDREAMREDFLGGEEFGFAVYQQADEKSEYRRWPETKSGFIKGDVRDFATLISAVSLPKEDIEEVADEVAALVNDSAHLLSALPDAIKEKIDGRINRGSVLTSLKTTMVLWLNALLTQQRLHKQDVRDKDGRVVKIPPLNFSSAKTPNHVKQIKVWRKIQRLNWRAIFDPAIKVLKIAGDSDPRAVGKALKRLVKAANRIERAGLGLHINVGAELFPKLSDDRKKTAAFYTQAPTAELLAALTIRQDDLPKEEWADSALFARRSIADLACGTGTLLRAGYRRAQVLHEANSVEGGG